VLKFHTHNFRTPAHAHVVLLHLPSGAAFRRCGS
jgi:hypothetical protein